MNIIYAFCYHFSISCQFHYCILFRIFVTILHARNQQHLKMIQIADAAYLRDTPVSHFVSIESKVIIYFGRWFITIGIQF